MLFIIAALLLGACAKEAPEPEFRPDSRSVRDNKKIVDNLFATPNVFASNSIIRYKLLSYGEVKLELLDSELSVVEILDEGFKNAGDHHVNVYGGFLADGKYTVRLSVRGDERSIVVYKSRDGQ